MPIRAVDVVRKIAPHAHPCYLQGFDLGDGLLQMAGIVTPRRLAAFLAEAMEETGGFTIERESGNYTHADRIFEIFGVGHHSAAVTMAEAERLVGNGPALFERVYGLGNPKKAKELGNTQPGDGWKMRGNGTLQMTGRGAHHNYGVRCGVDFENHPELVTAPEHVLKPALGEWSDGNLNEIADIGDENALTHISHIINGGSNGLKERIGYFHHILPLIDAVAFHAAQAPAVTVTAPIAQVPTDDVWHDRERIKRLQRALKAGGADPGPDDGLLGPKTVRAFQTAQKLNVTGVIDATTRSLLSEALASV